MNAAVANAVFNATGRRVRTLPIRLESLLPGAELVTTSHPKLTPAGPAFGAGDRHCRQRCIPVISALT
jgi:hypothetical protein